MPSIEQAAWSSFLTRVMVLGEVQTAYFAMAVGALFFAILRRWAAMAGFLWVVGSGVAFHQFLEMFLGRPGFPSGHAANVTLVSGALLYFLWPISRTPLRKILLSMMALGCVAGVSGARSYLGLNDIYDIAAGVGFGVSWIAILYLVRVRLT